MFIEYRGRNVLEEKLNLINPALNNDGRGIVGLWDFVKSAVALTTYSVV